MLPRVIMHSAVSLDGRTDGFQVDMGLFYELIPRWKEDATLVGCDTLLSAPGVEIPPEDGKAFEKPEVDPNDSRPLLVVPDSRGRLRSWHFWRTQPYWRAPVALVSRSTPKEYLEYLAKRHVDQIMAGDDHVDMRGALEELNARYGVKTARTDCGGTLNGALLRAGLVSEVSVVVHPALVGGTSPRSIFRAPDLTGPDGAISLKLGGVEQLRGDAVWLRYDVI